MKIGEVAVISHISQNKDVFIKSICKTIDIKNKLVSFGRFDVNEQLALHLYGIHIDKQSNGLSWDLISRKMLGYFIIFDWEDKNSLESIKHVMDHFSNNQTTQIAIVANVKNILHPPIPEKFFKPDGINLSSNFRFTFCQIDNPQSTREIMTLLINMLLEKVG